MDHKDSRRLYRLASVAAPTEASFQVVVEQTDLQVVAARDLSRETTDIVKRLRGQIKTAIDLYPGFGTSLGPIEVPENAPPMVRRMAEAARTANVGPMAAVAGAVAQAVADELRGMSPEVLVENGGDVFIHSSRERVVGLLPVPDEAMVVGIKIPAREFPTAICASSGKVGHSVSFGKGDIAVVRANSGALADAMATATANMLQSKADLTRALDRAREMAPAGVTGFFAQCQGEIAVWGRMELTKIA